MDNRANVRSINAVLRGLLRLGNHKQIHTFTKHPINVKDVTTKEYMIALYSIESELGLIRPILKESVSDEDVSLTSLINLATLNCLIGDVESADILVKEFEEHSKKLEVNARRSVRLFKKHQVAQLRNRNKFIKTYIKNTIDTPKEQRRKYQFNNSKEVFQLYPRKTEVIQFNTMFNNDNPVNIELCSGYGEWLITRAKDNLNENWVGVELYRDRVYNSWASKTFAGLNNVGCVWGDAIAVLMLCLMPNTVDKIYLNFPEPPKYENSPTNLFTSQIPVVVSIIEKVFTHTPLLNNKFQSQGRDFFVKKMPQNYGTSYFDQLWKNGKINQDRFFMHIKKIA
ncbi:tRNA (guanine(46)-N(7))-methyltransferase [Entamoeba marina]